MSALKSTDSGKTWTTLGAFPAQSVSPQTVLRDPLNPGLLYASTYGSLFISADGGQTWTTKQIFFDGLLLADGTTDTVYGASGSRLIMTRDGFNTVTPLGPASLPPYTSVKVSRGAVLVSSSVSSDAFVTKLDPDGNIVYSTYIGGTSYDSASSMAVDASGSVYVTGSTSSLDFPVTTGAYSTKPPQSNPSFVFKLDPNGKLAWSTFFGPGAGAATTIAVDAAGSVYLGGTTSGGLPTTPGSYQPQFNGTYPPGGPGFIGPPLPQPTNAFVTRFKPDGSGLIYSTYLGKQTDTSNTLAVAPDGSAYVGGSQHYFKLSSDGSSVLATAVPPFLPTQTVADSTGNLWAVGSTPSALSNAGSTHKFVNAVTAPPLPGGYGMGNSVAVVTKFAPDLTPIETALIGGENGDQGHSVALD
ncbi:MAG TPA: SBBP repeat-containing protein, partial [Chloroflexota bacterium]|nr:SBBP repeat-containing protein [Chloroflexota bacterium]